jgi:hypothetical protein
MAHFDIPSESIWQFSAEVIAHPQPGQLDSLIISDFPAIFTESKETVLISVVGHRRWFCNE